MIQPIGYQGDCNSIYQVVIRKADLPEPREGMIVALVMSIGRTPFRRVRLSMIDEFETFWLADIDDVI